MEFEEPLVIKLKPCSFCGRKFALANIHRHENICQKTSCNKRTVFNSSKQRSIQSSDSLSKYTSIAVSSPKSSKLQSQQNWRQKHEELMKTVHSARKVTAALKQGKPLPPPPPSTINPDYIQCPYCLRRFNNNAAERHIKFCAEQSKRLCNRNPSANYATRQAAARTLARQHYHPPRPCSNKDINRNSTVDVNPKQSKKAIPGVSSLARSSYSASCSSSEPIVRKMASKNIFSKQSWLYDSELLKDDCSFTTKYKDTNIAVKAPENCKFGLDSKADSYSCLQPDGLHAKSMPSERYAKFCHECGTRYLISTAKFCCECGTKRIVIS